MLLHAPLFSTCVFLHWGQRLETFQTQGPTEPPHFLYRKPNGLWGAFAVSLNDSSLDTCSFPAPFLLSQLFVRLRNHLHPPKQKPRSEQKLWLDEWLEEVFVKKKGKKRN